MISTSYVKRDFYWWYSCFYFRVHTRCSRNAETFSGQRFVFSLVALWEDTRWTTSTLPFAWWRNMWTFGFTRSSPVTLTPARSVVKITLLLFPDFFSKIRDKHSILISLVSIQCKFLITITNFFYQLYISLSIFDQFLDDHVALLQLWLNHFQ